MRNITKAAMVLGILAILFWHKRALASGSNMFTDEQLRRIDSRVKKNMAAALGPAMAAGGITTLNRMAAFLAQILHETGGFFYKEEIASGQAYEGRKDLGNTQPGDGRRYKGRGFIMITGRFNYAAAGTDLGLDLVGSPELALEPDIAARIAVWFWTKKGLNSLADADDIEAITRKINGGVNGLAERKRLYANAKKALNDLPVA